MLSTDVLLRLAYTIMMASGNLWLAQIFWNLMLVVRKVQLAAGAHHSRAAFQVLLATAISNMNCLHRWLLHVYAIMLH